MTPSEAAQLTLVFTSQGDRTVTQRAIAQPPLQLSRLRYDDPADSGRAAVTLLHQAGVVQGDCYVLDITAGGCSRATLATAAATQVYRAPEHGAEQHVHLDIGEHASFRYLPEPLILCAGADFRQVTNVRLAPTASLILLDVLVPGRLQRGELWRFHRFCSALTVTAADGHLLVAERSDLRPDGQNWVGTGISEAPVVGSAYLLGRSYPPLLPALRREVSSTLLGVDLLPNQAGVIVRMLGSSGSAVRRALLGIIEGVEQVRTR